MIPNILQYTGQLPPPQTKNDQTQNVSSAKAEKPFSSETSSPSSHFWSIGYPDPP